jgi:hypothetical protein
VVKSGKKLERQSSLDRDAKKLGESVPKKSFISLIAKKSGKQRIESLDQSWLNREMKHLHYEDHSTEKVYLPKARNSSIELLFFSIQPFGFFSFFLKISFKFAKNGIPLPKIRKFD